MIAPLRLAAVVAATAAALGCAAAASHNVISVNVADSSTAVAAERTIATAPAWGSNDDTCRFTASPGYIEGGGGDSQVIQDDSHNYMGCGGGPNISLDHTDGDTVTFSLHGDRVRVRQGATERLGPYRVHVVDVRGQRVELELSDPD